MKEQNCKIRSTMLGVEDHGITTFMIHLEGEGWGQGYGGYGYGNKEQSVGDLSMDVRRLLDTLEITEWEKLKGVHVRVRHDEGGGCSRKILAIGHIVKDRWFSLGEKTKE